MRIYNPAIYKFAYITHNSNDTHTAETVVAMPNQLYQDRKDQEAVTGRDAFVRFVPVVIASQMRIPNPEQHLKISDRTPLPFQSTSDYELGT
jgi:hypothetical protein